MAHYQDVRKSWADARWEHVKAGLITIGHITLTWAIIEREIDELIAWYQHHHTDLSVEHPRSLSSKLRYMRKIQNDRVFNEKTKEFLRVTRIEIKRLGDRRHDVIHGTFWRTGQYRDVYNMQRVTYEGPRAWVTHKRFTLDEMDALLSEMSSLAADIAIKIWVISGHDETAYAMSDIEKTKGELGII